MKIRAIIFLCIGFLLALVPLTRGGLIFDNGSGQKNDTLVVQFCFLDSLALDYTALDTVYIKQCYGSVAFKEVTLTGPTNYDVGNSWPATTMFEWRSKASDSAGHIGAYTWWALVTKNYNNKRVRNMHKGWYYVSENSMDSLIVASDTSLIGTLRRLLKIDSIRMSIGMPSDTTGINLHRKLGPYAGGDDNVRNDINALSLTGGGSEACTLLVKQDSISAIQSARIVIRSLDQTTTRVPGLFTNIDGKGIAELDESSYYISITANNYAPVKDTIVIHCDSTWLFNMTPFDPGEPSLPGLCRVYGWVYDISGNDLADVSVSVEIPSDYQPIKYGDIIITPFKKSTSSDSTGYWQIDLIPNNVLSKSDSKYLFIIEYPSGVIVKSKAIVPDEASWQFR